MNDARALENHMQRMASGDAPASKVMAFDPTTGELMLVPSASSSRGRGAPPPHPDAVIVDAIAEVGFFAARE